MNAFMRISTDESAVQGMVNLTNEKPRIARTHRRVVVRAHTWRSCIEKRGCIEPVPTSSFTQSCMHAICIPFPEKFLEITNA